MARIRRTRHAFLYLEDDYELDFASLLRGEVPQSEPGTRIVALAILTGEQQRLERGELEALISVPTDRWVSDDGHELEQLRALIDKGLVLSDSDESRLAALRERDQALSANGWHRYASLYHHMTRWSGVDTDEGLETDEELAEYVEASNRELVGQYGPAPDAFATPRAGRTVALPGQNRDGPLYRILTGRRTTRAFDLDVPMTLAQLDSVLRYVFGCHGYASATEDYGWIKRTSPSGGALHPVEVYPIITNVTGISPGIYQYGVREHNLTLLEALDAGEARTTAASFMCNQRYFGAAHVSFILTARFDRTYWKYRFHDRAYAGILMDAGHLSQTLYLVSGELGLGAFVTIAINGADIERHLGFDGVAEGVIAMAGCGVRRPGSSPLELEFAPHVLTAPPARRS